MYHSPHHNVTRNKKRKRANEKEISEISERCTQQHTNAKPTNVNTWIVHMSSYPNTSTNSPQEIENKINKGTPPSFVNSNHKKTRSSDNLSSSSMSSHIYI